MNKTLNKNIKDCYKYVFSFIAIFMLTGCGFNNNYYDEYHNDNAIATNNSYKAQSSSSNFDNDNKTLTQKIEKLSGCIEILQANVKNECDSEIYFSINANYGKAKLILIKPNSEVQILKEVIAEKDNGYEGTIPFRCDVGNIKIKIVGDNYSGDFKISQSKDSLFTYSYGKIFDSDLPFNSENQLN